MHGTPEEGRTGEPAAAAPPDWPAPDAPLPGEEPTVELPVVTEAMLAAHPPAVPPAVRHSRIRRVPALERLGPRPLAVAPSASATGGSWAGATTGARPENTTGTRTEATTGAGIEAAAGAGIEATTGAGIEAGTSAVGVGSAGRDDHREQPGRDSTEAARPAEPGRRWTVGAGIAAAALLLTGATVVVLSRDRGPAEAGPAGWNPPAAAPAPDHTVTAARDGRTSAGFDLIDGAEQITLRAADLGDTLYRITTPETGPGRPRAEDRDGRVRLRLDGAARAVDVTLRSAVLWDLRVAGGADLSSIDLSAGRVGGVALTGGAGRITLTLPRPDGTLGVRMSGGVSLFDVRTADRIPVRVRVGRGAGQVTLNGRNHAGVAAGQTFTPAAWGAAVDRVDVDAAAGMSALTVASY